nr:hypothetical protein [Tanacetum cinerariifolium]
MRTKRDKKVPQNLEDYVHSINTVKNKSKKNVTKKNENINEKLSVNNQNTKNNKESDYVGKGIEINSEKGMGNDGKKGFDGDLNGIQFPLISKLNKDESVNIKENKECLDEGRNSENNTIKSVDYYEKVNNEEEEVDEEGINEVINNGPWMVNNKPPVINNDFKYRRRHENEVKDNGFNVNIGVNDKADGKKDNNGKTSNNNENVKENEKEYQKGSTSKKNSSDGVLGSNRFTLLDSLVHEADLVPNTKQRNIVDEVVSKESNGKNGERNGWTGDMKRYYRDRKGMFVVVRNLKENKDVLEEDDDENNNVFRNEVEGSGGSFK